MIIKHLKVLILALGCSLLFSGCATWDDPDNNEEQLPWSKPASWEGQGMGLPY